MQTSVLLQPAHSRMPRPNDPGQSDGPGRILLRVFETLDSTGIPYCVLHGYERYPRIKSDVDCIIDPKISPRQLLMLLQHKSERIGAEAVHCRGYYIVLAGKNSDGSLCFLTLDMAADCELHGLPLYAGREILASRRRHQQFWIPAADVEFGCYLARTIAKGTLDDERTHRLSSLYRLDAALCAQQVARFWSGRNGELIRAAAESGHWEAVHQQLHVLRAELRWRAILRRPAHFAGNKLRAVFSRLGRIYRPGGLTVVLLGPDGAGKSSVVELLGKTLTPAFSRSTCWGFAPSLGRLFGRGSSPTNQPHGLPARSLLTSLMRAGYWLVYYTVGHLNLRLVLARSTLVLYDRHFIDILVDTRRYRYGGPLWVLRLIWRVIPKPNLIVLLDAPAETLQSRKQEVPFDETARQRRAYLSLVRGMKNVRIVNAAQPLENVAADVTGIVLTFLANRIAGRVQPE